MKRRSSSDGLAASVNTFEFNRIRVNAQGYDSTGAYWGAGSDVFIASSVDGAEVVTVRARNVTEARKKVATELAREPGEVRSGTHEPIGGNAPRKTRYEIKWRNPLTSETIRIRITHARDYLSTGSDHLEIESINPNKSPLPITETGYRSHFMSALDLINAGGPVTFVTAWIDREASGRAWNKATTAKAQGDLFQWAQASVEVGTKRKAKPVQPAARPTIRPKRGRAPE